MVYKDLIDLYLKAKENAFSPATLRTEKSRLYSVVDVLPLGPVEAYAILRGKYKEYTLATVFSRIVAFMTWAIDRGHIQGANVWKQWKEDNRRLFKHAYKRRFPALGFAKAKELILTLTDEGIREAALALLTGGLRVSEVKTAKDGHLIGKGGKERATLVTEGKAVSYPRLYAALKKIGIKPHDLRKIAATHLRSQGLSEEEMCQFFGWSRFETSRSYLKPSETADLLNKVGDMVNG